MSDDERMGGSLPSLKLKPEMIIEVSEPVSVVNGLEALKQRNVRNVLVRDGPNDLEAILVPVERYVELVGRELQLSRTLEVRADGQLQPDGLTDSDVELTDPTADWPHLRRR